MISKDLILQRKKELEQQRDVTLANFNALLGAIQDCEYWLAELDKPAPVDTE